VDKPQTGKLADEVYSNDSTIWHECESGDWVRATVKPNIADFRDQEGIELLPEKKELAGKRETFIVQQYTHNGVQKWMLTGFGLRWRIEWLEDLKKL